MDIKHAHQRIDNLETSLKTHIEEHLRFESLIAENTVITKQIAENTSELVSLVKGVKGLRTFMVWVTPIAVGIIAIVAWIRAQ